MTAPDVVVVGGGLIGMLTACELAERGVGVVVVEKDDVGFEQSGRSVAAVNLPGGTRSGRSDSMLRASADEWSTFEQRWGCVIDLNDEGWHILVADEEDERWLAIDRALWNETAGYPGSELLDPATARERFPQLAGDFLGLEVRHGGHVDAVLVMRGLRSAAERLGVTVRCDTPVTGFDLARGAISAVRIENGSIPCGAMVVAAGMWSGDLLDPLGLHVPMQRVRAPAAETGPVPANSIPGFLRGSTFGARQNRNGSVRITGGYRYSAMLHDLSFRDLRDLRTWAPALWQNRKDVRFRVDGSILAGEIARGYGRLRRRQTGTTVPQHYNPTARPRDRQAQLRDLARFVPALRGARIHRAFAGVMDLTPDLQPVIGQLPGLRNAFVSTGFSGHGYIYGPGACRGVASLIVDGAPAVDLEPFRPERLAGTLRMRAQIF